MRRVAVLSAGITMLHEMARQRDLSPTQRHQVVDADHHDAAARAPRRPSGRAARRGEPLGAESTLTKVALTQAEQEIFAVTHDLLGPGGIAWSGEEPEEVELYLYSRAASIYGGSAQIQRNVLAERFLGLPSEPRPAKT